MAMSFPPAMRRLVNELTKLPSVGEKSAIRLAYHLVTRGKNDSELLAKAILEAREKTRFCEGCFALSEEEICSICADEARDNSLLCVVEKPADVVVIERSGGFRGRYHVLHGLWSPMRGVGPEQTTMKTLLDKLRSAADDEPRQAPIREIILATGATVEGDATALYIAQAVQHLGLSVTRIAQGLPKGGELEYADDLTLAQAIQGRRGL